MLSFYSLRGRITLFLTVLLFLCAGSVLGQVGIGTFSPNPNSILELKSNSRGFILPRLTNAQRTALGTALGAGGVGTLVYDNQDNTTYQWTGSAWVDLGVVGGGVANVGVTAPITNTGTAANPVIALASGSSNGQVLTWNGSTWAPAAVTADGTTITGTGTTINPFTVATGGITSTQILDGTIVDADIASGAGIQGGKITPNFGAQNVVTTGTLNAGAITGTSFTGSGAGLTATSVPLTALNSGGAGLGQVLQYNGSNWVPAAAGTGTVTSVTGVAGQTTTGGTAAAPTIGLPTTGVGGGNYGSGTGNNLQVPFITVDIYGRITNASTTTLAVNSDGATIQGDGSSTNKLGVIDGSITGTKIATGTVTGANLAPAININTTGNITANSFIGNGAGLTGITSTVQSDGITVQGDGSAGNKLAVKNGSITDAQVSATAAIAGSKVIPAFGTQNISTLGTLSAGAVTGTSFSGVGANLTLLSILNIAPGGATNNQVLQYNGSNWVPGLITGPNLAPTINITTTGNITASNFTGNGSGLTGITSTVNSDGATIQGDGSAGNKLTVPTGGISSNQILDGTILDADIASGAGIQGGKITPNFGVQNIVTTGTLNAGAITGSSFTGSGAGLSSASVPLSALGGGTTTGQVLTYTTGTGWGPGTATYPNVTTLTPAYVTLSGSGTANIGVSLNTPNIIGAINAGGDVTGPVTATVVGKLQGSPISATPPIANQILQYIGGVWTPTTPGAGGTVTSVSVTPGPLSIINPTTTPQISISVGTTAGSVAAGDDPRIVNALPSGATAGGDLTGTYPNPTIGAGKVVTGYLAPNIAISTTGNITTTGAGSITAGAGLNAGAANQFAVNNTGNITKINNVSTSFPAAQGGAGTVLTNNGAGLLTWNPGGITLPFTASDAVSNVNLFNIQNGGTAGAAGTFAVSNSANGNEALSVTTNSQASTGYGAKVTSTSAAATAPTLYVATSSNQNTQAIQAQALGTTGQETALYGNSNSINPLARGVFGEVLDGSTANQAVGIFGSTSSTYTGTPAASSHGVEGLGKGTTGSSVGVYGSSAATSGIGGYFTNSATTAGIALEVNGFAQLDPITAPAVTANRLYNVGSTLFFNGTALGAGGSVTSVSVTPGPLSIINPTTTPQISISVGTTAGSVAAGDDPRIVNALPSGATAGGDLTGTYPNPTIGAGKVVTSYLAPNIVISTTGNITTTGAGSITAGAGLNAGAANQFAVSNTGNITKINNVTTSFPAAQGGAGTVLTNNGVGILTWNPLASGWGLTGNAGTVDGTNFIGTTDNIALSFRVNNLKAGRIENGTNTFLGLLAGSANTGNQNTAFGSQALANNLGGGSNAAFGEQALKSNTTGGYNVAVGQIAMSKNTTGGSNIAIGVQANNNNVGGSTNTAIGYNANFANVASDNNSALGGAALFNNTGAGNTAMGANALLSNTSGTNNTAIGFGADVSSGSLSNATAIGYNAKVAASNSLVLGGTGVDAVKVGIGTTTPSNQLTVTNEVANSVIGIDEYSSASAANESILTLSRSRGTALAPAAILDGDFTGAIYFAGNYGAGKSVGAVIGSGAVGDWSGTSRGSFISFRTAQNGSTANLERIRIADNGNVGIGTTSPADLLDVEGPVYLKDLGVAPGTVTNRLYNIGSTLYFNGTTLGGGFSTLNSIPKGNGSGLVASLISDDGNTVSVTNNSSTDVMVLNNNNAGQYGVMALSSPNHGGYLSLRMNGAQEAYLYNNGSDAWLGTQTTIGNLHLATNNIDRLYIASTGNVGIGTTGPADLLDVEGPVFLKSLGVAPGTVANRFYNVTGRLTWNGIDQVNDITNSSIAIGTVTGHVNTGAANVFLGFQAGEKNTSGGSNHFVGYNAGLRNTTGSNNYFDGLKAGNNNLTGSDNHYSGYQAAINETAGSKNMAIGNSAGYANGLPGRLDLTNENKIALIGYKAQIATAGITNAAAIGYEASVSQSNSLVLGAPNGTLDPLDSKDIEVNVGIGTNAPIAKLDVNGSIHLSDTLPAATANRLYSQTGTLYWNGAPVGGGVVVDGSGSLLVGPTGNTTNSGAGLSNTFLGINAGNLNTSGSRNLFAGAQAGANNNTGGYNVFLGMLSGNANTSGVGNSFVGYSAGYNSNGGNNSFFGYEAGFANTTGSDNYFSGYQAGFSNTLGQQNTFIGSQAGFKNFHGLYNFFGGYQAGYNNTDGNDNTAIGWLAGYSNTTGGDNTTIGWKAGYSNVANNNHFVGVLAGVNNNTGSNNHFEGYKAGLNNTTGSSNYFSGYNAGFTNQTGSYITAIGFKAGLNNTADYNHFVGYQAGYNNTSGGANTYDGFQAGYTNTINSNNAFFGYMAGYSNNSAVPTEASNNSFFGSNSGLNNTTGRGNAAFGFDAGQALTTGKYNTLIGANAGANTTNVTVETGITLLGNGADINTFGISNATAIGYNATVNQSNSIVLGNAANVLIGTSGYSTIPTLHVYNPIVTSGSGLQEALRVTSGGQTFGDGPAITFQSAYGGSTPTSYQDWITASIGSPYSGSYQGDLTFYTNDGSIQSGPITTSALERMRITSTGNVGIGTATPTYKFQLYGNNTGGGVSYIENINASTTADGLYILLNNTASSNDYVFFERTGGSVQGRIAANGVGAVQYLTASDRRLKDQINDFKGGLDMVLKMQPRNYVFKGSPDFHRIGFIAQELKQIFPEAVNGDELGDAEKEPMMVDYSKLTPVLTSSIQELNAVVVNEQHELDSLRRIQDSSNSTHTARLTKLEATTTSSVTLLKQTLAQNQELKAENERLRRQADSTRAELLRVSNSTASLKDEVKAENTTLKAQNEALNARLLRLEMTVGATAPATQVSTAKAKP